MQRKTKLCAGFDGKPHEDYIYKNIDGKKYCKSCTFKLQPPKAIKKVSEKGKFKLVLKKELLNEDKLFYLRVWNERSWLNSYGERTKKCENCSKLLEQEPNLMNFHHILEKRNYPQFRHVEENIAILCPGCHNSYESNPDNIPWLFKMKETLLKKLNQ
jgi:hypothetical protein